MFSCERCGSRFSATHAVSIEHCPRCQARDRIESPLTFKPFADARARSGVAPPLGANRAPLPGPGTRQDASPPMDRA